MQGQLFVFLRASALWAAAVVAVNTTTITESQPFGEHLFTSQNAKKSNVYIFDWNQSNISAFSLRFIHVRIYGRPKVSKVSPKLEINLPDGTNYTTKTFAFYENIQVCFYYQRGESNCSQKNVYYKCNNSSTPIPINDWPPKLKIDAYSYAVFFTFSFIRCASQCDSRKRDAFAPLPAVTETGEESTAFGTTTTTTDVAVSETTNSAESITDSTNTRGNANNTQDCSTQNNVTYLAIALAAALAVTYIAIFVKLAHNKCRSTHRTEHSVWYNRHAGENQPPTMTEELPYSMAESNERVTVDNIIYQSTPEPTA